MCGPKFCSMHITREIERKFGKDAGKVEEPVPAD